MKRSLGSVSAMALVVLLAGSARQDQDDEEAPPPPAPPGRLSAVLFDVGGTLAYREPETGKYAWYDDALSTAEALREMGLRVGVLSNVPRGWDVAMLRRLLAEPEPLDELFDPIVLAQSPPPPGQPPPKPDPMAYQTAVSHLGTGARPAQVVYVGEDPTEVRGALLAGLRGILLVREGAAPRRYPNVIRGLDELIEALGAR